MTTGDLISPRELSFGRTVERRLVHRASVAEVFVTDLVPAGESRFLAAAQLPLSHGYYSDHLARPAHFDPLLILEAGRQAGIAGAHLLGLPPDTTMMVNTFSLDLPDPAALRTGRRPGELRIDNHFETLRVRAGRVRKGAVRQDLSIGDVPVGTHTMEVQIVTHAEHEALRTVLRGTPAPLTGDLEDVPAPGQAEPYTVGRVSPMNVVLSQVERGPSAVSARVTPRYGNRAIFDHDYDHLPAMTLTEAARQLALVALGDAAAWPATVSGSFGRFAELDQPVLAAATRTDAGDGTVTVNVAFIQEAITIAESTMVMVPR
ncbi:AfsA-related hotdog domain-containing protein [Streptosporangium saharense]|uniref:AfsA-related hotdog domain-containing protein n=1 Tax=Streptosporangium saharense TaxID=1706840 RepID=UPI00367C242E